MDFLHIIRFIVMSGIWVMLFFLIRTLDKRLRYIFFVYFGVLTAVFISGYVFYYVRYDLYANPMPEAVYDLGNWVYSFSIFFVIPFLFLVVTALYRFVRHFPTFQKVILGVVAVINGVILSYFLTMIFMLVFYGFAP